MTELIRKVISGYNILFVELADPRTISWPLVAKPFQIVTILALYLMFILKWGPKMMKNRQPFNLDKIMIIYNAIQVIVCGWLFAMSIIHAWGWKYKWICEPVDTSESGHAVTVAKYVYIYFLLKISDLADTIFFVLRKKKNQLSFLHLYHHTGMVLLAWGGITYVPGGHGTSIGVLNSFVHCYMYTYYLLTVASPTIKKSLRFKKLITQIQITQFLLISIHFMTLVLTPDCAFPRWIAALILPQNTFMLILFLNFYIKTYVRKSDQKLNNNIVIADENMEANNRNEADIKRENDLQFTVPRLGAANINWQQLAKNNLNNDSNLILSKDKRE